MTHVERAELLDWVTWSERRDALRERVLAVKAVRRVHVGEHLTLLFENADTIRYQIQEMIRAERMQREDDIRHELETYNELLGRQGELGVSLLIELPEPAERDRKLREWLALPRHVYVKVDGGEKVRATFDARQVGDDRLSSVQYLKFDVHGRVPVAVGCDLPGLAVETELTDEQREALRADLRSDA